MYLYIEEGDILNYEDAFKALGDSNRVKIINVLKENESCCACKLLECLNVTQPTLSHHMKILKNANLVNANKEGQWMHYSLNEELFEELAKFFSI